jgi:K+-transporting ATPase ATPase C chain
VAGPRVAKARKLSIEQVTRLVNEATQTPLPVFSASLW